MSRDYEYENNNIGYDEQYIVEDGGGIKCKNYELCERVLPKWWFEYKDNYLCSTCHMMFGTWTEHTGKKHIGKGILPIFDNIECCICLEIKKNISQPRCDHLLCITCFRRWYYGDVLSEDEPVFPYPDIEDEYYDDQQNVKWNNEYPLIKKYNDEWNMWDDERQYKRNIEAKYLAKCPLCRI